MRLLKSLLTLLISISVLTSCNTTGGPTADQVKKVIEENPDIVFDVIKKNPKKFLDTVNETAKLARQVEEKNFKAEQDKMREQEFANPKKPAVQANRAIDGKKDAKITIVEYSDFQCPFCQRGANTMQQVIKAYPNDVRVVFKHFPIERIHPQAKLASQYYEAIALQSSDKALAFKAAIFARQRDIGTRKAAFLDEAAKKVGANLSKVKKDINSKAVLDIIAADMKEASDYGFSGTPGYLVNGVSLKGAYPLEEFKTVIEKWKTKL